MTCLEAQSNIISYIEQGLEKDKKIEFLKHIQKCDDCKEELVIYYTMIKGMHQLDSNQPISKDFRAELEMRIDRELKQNSYKKNIVLYSVILTVAFVLFFSVAGYINFLKKLYTDEQDKIKAKQGDYYYSAYFDDILFDPNEKLISINVEPEETTEQSFYSKIREYNVNKK